LKLIVAGQWGEARMAIRSHELWVESEQEQTFCFAGPLGDEARALLLPEARLVWTVEAESHFEAMRKYYKYMGWGAYETIHEADYEPYLD
jgi:hypothetical protein